jgi:hypothetical protein
MNIVCISIKMRDEAFKKRGSGVGSGIPLNGVQHAVERGIEAYRAKWSRNRACKQVQ